MTMVHDPIDVTSDSVTPSSVAVVPARDVSPVITSVPVAQVQAQQENYRALCEGLLDDTDYQQIAGKKFRKKSGWRKLAVAFNVSTTLVSMKHERDQRGRIVRSEAVVRAVAPNGRVQDGYGACDLFEKCCEGEGVCRMRYSSHTHCGADCPGTIHFSSYQHDIPSTAMTRATNRAQSDLFGMGEVSAEELNRNRSGSHDDDTDQGPPPGPPWWETLGFMDEDHARATNDSLQGLIDAIPKEDRDPIKSWLKDKGYNNFLPVALEHAVEYSAVLKDARMALGIDEPSGDPATTEPSAGDDTSQVDGTHDGEASQETDDAAILTDLVGKPVSAVIAASVMSAVKIMPRKAVAAALNRRSLVPNADADLQAERLRLAVELAAEKVNEAIDAGAQAGDDTDATDTPPAAASGDDAPPTGESPTGEAGDATGGYGSSEEPF